jgi:hypothetical protein
MSQPVRRGPGRPRKLPDGAHTSGSEPYASLPKVSSRPAVGAPTNKSDPRIGMKVHPDAAVVGFDDGSQYRAAGGVLVEKLN